MNHVKYMNNYDYNKAIYLLEDISFLDNGFMILRENDNYIHLLVWSTMSILKT